MLLHAQRFVDVKVCKFSVLVPDDPVRLARGKKIRRVGAHHRRIDPVLTGRAAASLHVPEDRRARLKPGRRLNPARHTRGMADPLRVHDDMVLLSVFPVVDDIVDQLRFKASKI